MFNQLTAPQIVTAIGEGTRSIARGTDGELGDFERDQLMSMYSATRHLSVELTSYAPEMQRFQEALGAVIFNCEGSPEARSAINRLQQAIRKDGDTASVADALCDLLAVWREEASPAAIEHRLEVQVLLRTLADREVELLAEGLG